jgi:hypothetical protein
MSVALLNEFMFAVAGVLLGVSGTVVRARTIGKW